jgi:hypothetical protein
MFCMKSAPHILERLQRCLFIDHARLKHFNE